MRTDDGELVFQALGEPSPEEVAEVARRTAVRVGRILQRHGRSLEGLFEGASDSEDDPLAEEQLALASCYGAAARGVGLFGARAGEPILRPVRPELGRDAESVAEVLGCNVHAGLALDGRDRKRVERVCGYLGRPPIAQERLREIDNGRFVYTMKSMPVGAAAIASEMRTHGLSALPSLSPPA